GLAVTLESVALTTGAMNVTAACWVNVTELTVAVIVLSSAVVVRIVALVWPLVSVTAGVESTLLVPVQARVTVLLVIATLLVSRTVTEIVAYALPSAAMLLVGLAVIVDSVALGGATGV